MPSLHFATSVTAAHVLTDSRAPAAPWPGPTRRRSGSRSSIWASITSWTSPPASASPKCAAAPQGRPARAGVSSAVRFLERRARGSGITRPRHTPRRRARRSCAIASARSSAHRGGRGRGPRPGDQPPQRAHARPFLLLSIAALYFLLPQIAHLNDTWKRIEDGSPYWMIVAVLFGVGMFFGYVAMFRGIFLRAGSGRIDWRASYQITMAGLAASRIFAAAAPAAGADRVGAAPLGDAQAARGRQDADLPDPHLHPVHGRADRVRPRPAARDLPRRGAVPSPWCPRSSP